MRHDIGPMCPIPGLGHCVRERCNFWDEEKEECTEDGFDFYDPVDATAKTELEGPCVIYFCEDYD
ncbi:MAG: hypothetical protein ACOZFS_10505 [Thermodesulfobacteriota bacterium]